MNDKDPYSYSSALSLNTFAVITLLIHTYTRTLIQGNQQNLVIQKTKKVQVASMFHNLQFVVKVQ